jgi:hypothetical protein
MANFLILFQATHDLPEQLALALGLGAVQQGGSIRLRLLSPADTPALMHQGYGRLKPADLAWADFITLGLEAGQPLSEIEYIFQSLPALPAHSLSAKHVYLYSAGDVDLAAVRDRLEQSGLQIAKDIPNEDPLTPEVMERIGNALATI